MKDKILSRLILYYYIIFVNKAGLKHVVFILSYIHFGQHEAIILPNGNLIFCDN